MQLSRFVITYRDVAPGEHVLYSVLTKRYAGVDDATLEAIQSWSAGCEPEDEEESSVAEYLSEAAFLVRSRSEDDRRLQEYLAEFSNPRQEQLHVSIMPTLACNIACTYCFQRDSPAFPRMGGDVESKTVRWIVERLQTSGARKLHLHFFGGEPLTRKEQILRTAEALHAHMASVGGELSWNITTNGIHLDLRFVQAMKRFGNGDIKVTLDGDRETHDQTRVYRDGRGTFDAIFQNLLQVAGHVRLRVGGNFYPGQEASYRRLVERMESADLLRKLDSVRFKPVIDTTRQESGSSCTGCSGSKKTADTLVQINRAVKEKITGMPAIQQYDTPGNPCELHWSNSFTIDPEGLVYKCPAVAGRPEMAVASVLDAGLERPAPLTVSQPWEQCGDCAYMPVCMGGCLAGEYLATGQLGRVHCRKIEFDAVFEEKVRRDYREELGAAEWEEAEALLA
jgi:uncharacterized protein